MINLADMYYYGKGTEKDLKRSFHLFRKAAFKGNEFGQYATGHMYQYGQGIEKNVENAKFWYQKAADQGEESAKKALADMQK